MVEYIINPLILDSSNPMAWGREWNPKVDLLFRSAPGFGKAAHEQQSTLSFYSFLASLWCPYEKMLSCPSLVIREQIYG